MEIIETGEIEDSHNGPLREPSPPKLTALEFYLETGYYGFYAEELKQRELKRQDKVVTPTKKRWVSYWGLDWCQWAFGPRWSFSRPYFALWLGPLSFTANRMPTATAS